MDAHGYGKRFIVRADEKLTAFLELESVIRAASVGLSLVTKPLLTAQFAPQGSQAQQSATEKKSCSAAIGYSNSSDDESKILVP